MAHQFGQQIRRDGVDHAQAQRPGQRVFTALGNFFDIGRLLQHALRLSDDVLAQRSHSHFVGAALEEFDLQFFFQIFDANRQRRLRHKAGNGRAAKMLFACHGNDVFQFGQGHGVQALRKSDFPPNQRST